MLHLIGSREAICRAFSVAAARGFSAVLRIAPQNERVVGSSSRVSSNAARAAALPSAEGRRVVPDHPVTSPRRTPGWLKRAPGPTISASHVRARSKPPPEHVPLIAQTTGARWFSRFRIARRPRRAYGPLDEASRSAISARCAPARKTLWWTEQMTRGSGASFTANDSRVEESPSRTSRERIGDSNSRTVTPRRRSIPTAPVPLTDRSIERFTGWDHLSIEA